MPTYDYRCKSCDKSFEAFHSINSKEPVFCPDCEGEATKLVSSAAVIYKGSGFYSTDYADPFSNANNKPSPKKEAQDAKEPKKD